LAKARENEGLIKSLTPINMADPTNKDSRKKEPEDTGPPDGYSDPDALLSQVGGDLEDTVRQGSYVDPISSQPDPELKAVSTEVAGSLEAVQEEDPTATPATVDLSGGDDKGGIQALDGTQFEIMPDGDSEWGELEVVYPEDTVEFAPEQAEAISAALSLSGPVENFPEIKEVPQEKGTQEVMIKLAIAAKFPQLSADDQVKLAEAAEFVVLTPQHPRGAEASLLKGHPLLLYCGGNVGTNTFVNIGAHIKGHEMEPGSSTGTTGFIGGERTYPIELSANFTKSVFISIPHTAFEALSPEGKSLILEAYMQEAPGYLKDLNDSYQPPAVETEEEPAKEPGRIASTIHTLLDQMALKTRKQKPRRGERPRVFPTISTHVVPHTLRNYLQIEDEITVAKGQPLPEIPAGSFAEFEGFVGVRNKKGHIVATVTGAVPGTKVVAFQARAFGAEASGDMVALEEVNSTLLRDN